MLDALLLILLIPFSLDGVNSPWLPGPKETLRGQAAVVGCLGTSLWLAIVCRRVGMSKGYTSLPVLGSLVLLGFFSGLVGGAIGGFLATEQIGPHGATAMSRVQYSVIVGCTLGTALLVHCGVQCVPANNRRRPPYDPHTPSGAAPTLPILDSLDYAAKA